ncbi:MAG: prepilin-type N-terminal cleavage/methylation domain-containing protein [Candidatus Hydrogenedentes bacterium]|nr:prepilin-type N-terminal cleavage/methylation domain-containing protein [Candidatus Hydrogenedentota bacterium]
MTRTRRQHGFSFMELVVALAILSIGIIAVVNLFPVGLRYARIAQERTKAAELADSWLGAIRMVGARDILRGGVNSDILTNTAGSFVTSSQLYEIQGLFDAFSVSVQRMPGAGQTSLQRVTFTIEMVDGRRESFVTYISEI